MSHSERDEWSLVLHGDLTTTRTRSASQVPTNLRPCVVNAANQLLRFFFDPQRRAMAVDHAHVSAIAIEASELVAAFGQSRMIVASHAHIIFELRKTADATRQAFRRYRHFWIMLRIPYASFFEAHVSRHPRCLHPGQQQGRRMPSSNSSRVLRMRRFRVTSCFASSTQQMNSLRANGVMSSQAVSAVAFAINVSRRSGGSSCTTPPGTRLLLMGRNVNPIGGSS